jgi:pimeloyl-ACP methyl ester carboxylesterase
MPETHLHTCTLCEATCGVVVTVDDGRVTIEHAGADLRHAHAGILPQITQVQPGEAELNRITGAQAPSGVRAEIEVIRSFQEGPEAHVPRPLPNVPVTTLLAARSAPPPPIELPFSYRDYFEAIIRHRVNHFSTSVLGLRHGTLVLATDDGHFIHAEDPHLVVEAVRRVVELAGEPN